jgi:hypothetical protein
LMTVLNTLRIATPHQVLVTSPQYSSGGKDCGVW